MVGLTAVFAGMVLALQIYTGFARFSPKGAIDDVVVLSIPRKLGPGAGRANGGRAFRSSDGGRDRYHARDRADRRPDHT